MPINTLRDINEDYLISVAKGNVPGESLVHKFGRNDAVPNGSWVFVAILGQSAHVLSAATTVRIKSGNAADDKDAGAGAREVTVQGIVETTFAEETDTLLPDGTTASASSAKSFWRVHRAWVSSCGTYGGANTGDVVIENGAGGTDIITIAAEEGQTQDALFTVPADTTGYLLSVHATVDSNKTTNIRCFTRENIGNTTAPVSSKRLKLFWDGVESPGFVYDPSSPEFAISQKSDIWFEAYGDGAVSQVSIDFELLLVDD